MEGDQGMRLVEYPDREMLAIDLANLLAGELNQALMTGEAASLAVPGGTTPGPVFDALCAADIDWSRVWVMLTDERWVAEEDPRSNTRLLRERLLVNRAAAARFVPFRTDHARPEEAEAELARRVAPALPLNVLLLGMGEDMHTASLFPGADRLADALAEDAPPVMAIRAPGAPEPRVTLTGPVLAGALSCHVLITGAAKRAALERALEADDPLKAPIRIVLDGATVHWAE